MTLSTMDAEIYYDDLGKDVRREEYSGGYEGACQQIPQRAYRSMLLSRTKSSWKSILKAMSRLLSRSKPLIRKATIANNMVPITCGTSYRNKGVQPLLDAIVDYHAGSDRHSRYQGYQPRVPTRKRTGTLPIQRALRRSCVQDRYRPVRW